jgi:hypothetical protein
MRFAMRFEHAWVNRLVLLAALAGVVVAAINLLLTGAHPRWPAFAQMVCWIILCAGFSRGHCDVRENDLLLRRGWSRRSIPYASLVELKARPDAYGVFAVANDGKRFVIAVANVPRFLREVYRRCPQLNPSSGSPVFGLMA